MRSPECCMSWNATSTEFLEVQIPPHTWCMAGIHGCPVSSVKSVQIFGANNNNNNKNMK